MSIIDSLSTGIDSLSIRIHSLSIRIGINHTTRIRMSISSLKSESLCG